MALDQAFAKQVQDHIHGVTALTMPTGFKLLLMTANGTATALGTELATGGGYTEGTGQPISFAAATAATPSLSGNSAAISFPNMPAATTVGVEVWASTVRTEFGALATAKTTVAGDTLSFAINSIASALQ